MSEKPQHLSSPAEDHVSRETSGPEKPTPPVEKNKPSSVYIYLVVLFGAAFLMLLLAYFVQQRNNAAELDNLRSTTTASREELLDQIEALEVEKEQLNAAIQKSENALEEEKQQRLFAVEQAEMHSDASSRRFLELERANTLAWLERFCTEGDWLMAAVVVESDDYFFNEKNRDYERNWAGGREAAPVQAAWYLALREEVFDNAGCMVVEGWQSSDDGSDYTERPYIQPSASRYDEETVNTAQNLWVIISSYSYSTTDPAIDIPPTLPFLLEKVMEFYTNGSIERLNSGAFQPSTVEVLEQITQDLTEQGLLTKP